MTDIKEMDGQELISSLCDSIHCKDEDFFNKVETELLSRLETGQKAIDFIDQLIAEFQDGMNEKFFYEMLNVYCGADPKPKQSNIGAKAIEAMKQIGNLVYNCSCHADTSNAVTKIFMEYEK